MMRRNSYVYMAFALFSLYLLLHSCRSEEEIRKTQYIANGQKLYAARCQNCHGANGEGLASLYPPLTDSVYLQKHRHQLTCIVKHGLSGPIEVNGQAFDGEMPATSHITPVEIAYVLTYITNVFGNEQRIFSQEEVHQSLQRCKQTAR